MVPVLGSRFDVPDAYDALYADMIQHGDAAFTLQHVVDAHAAQTATEHSKPIAIVFALVGLYLHVEKDYTGRQIQQIHMRMGRHKQQWPHLHLPVNRGAMTPETVLSAAPGEPRDAAIDAWCASVWEAFTESHDTIANLVREYGQSQSLSRG